VIYYVIREQLVFTDLRKRRFVCTTDSRHTYSVYPNLTNDWKPDGVNQLWVSDITYIRLRESLLYLAVILDAYPGE
jgi:putative transposase